MSHLGILEVKSSFPHLYLPLYWATQAWSDCNYNISNSEAACARYCCDGRCDAEQEQKIWGITRWIVDFWTHSATVWLHGAWDCAVMVMLCPFWDSKQSHFSPFVLERAAVKLHWFTVPALQLAWRWEDKWQIFTFVWTIPGNYTCVSKLMWQ